MMDIIIGAGISGLSYAAQTKNDYLILEADTQIGGYCKTIREQDYIWDYSGHFFHFQHESIRDFVMSQLQNDEVLKVEKHTQILYKGTDGNHRHIDYPFQKNIHQLEQQEFIDCLYDLFTKPEEYNAQSFKQMLYQKFGKSIANKFLIPYNEKLYATDLNTLSVDAMGRFFPYANKQEIIQNFKPSKDLSYNATFLYPKQGAIKIVEAIAKYVDATKICLDEKVISVNLERHEVTTNKRALHYDHLISTCPLPYLLEMCNINYDKTLYSWNKVLVLNLGFDVKGPEKQNNWLYFPNKEYIFYRVGFYDNIIGQHKMSLYVEIGFGKDEEVGDIDTILQHVLTDLKTTGIITNQKLMAYHSVIMNPAYVHITSESENDKQRHMHTLQHAGVYSIGRYGAWKYCSLEDNIQDAFTLARTL